MINRHARQIILSQIGTEGQEKLKRSCVAIVGMGALGSVAAELLCRAGVGRLKLIDFDILELDNLQRQALYVTEDVGKPKVDSAKERLGAIDPAVAVETVMDHLEKRNLSLLDNVDLVVDGTDNMETRFLINERCSGKRPVIFTSAVMDKGSVLPVMPGRACYACVYGRKRNTETCCTHGVLNGATHVAASIAATEALKALFGLPVMDGLFSFSLFDGRFDLLHVRRDPECGVCARPSRRT